MKMNRDFFVGSSNIDYLCGTNPRILNLTTYIIMRRKPSIFLAAAILAASIPLGAYGQVTLNFDAAKRGPMISPLQYGIFYEEINNAGDGGLYAELIRNRCFEDASSPEYWTAIGGADMSITRSGLMNENRRAALNLKLNGANEGISNTGYWGHSGTQRRDIQTDSVAKKRQRIQGLRHRSHIGRGNHRRHSNDRCST